MLKKNLLLILIVLSILNIAAVPVRRDGGLDVSPTSSEKSGLPNSVLTYDLTVSNTTGADQTVSVNVGAGSHGWNVWASSSSLTVANGSTAVVTISVAIKADAGLGDFEVNTISFSDGTHSTTASLTTRAVPPPSTATPTVTIAPPPTNTPSPTIPPALNRPLIIVGGYTSGGNVGSGEAFTLDVTFANNGQTQALNLVFTFASETFLMRDTGGVRTLGSLASGANAHITQPMTGVSGLSNQSAGTVLVKVVYNDASGETYSESFTLTINTKQPTGTATWSGSGSVKASATPTQSPSSQLVVTSYQASVDPLQPGTSFDLEIEVHNTGNADARAVSMVLGGGVTVDSSSGTPVPGVSSGSGTDLTNFAPLGTSNLIALGNIPQGGSLKVKSRLIVNVTTAPAAYPLKLSFVYTNSKNMPQVDNQVITLLVYSLPQVEVVFYRDPGMLMVGQPNPLPIQVTNLGRKNSVLGSMKVTSDQAEVTNNVIQIGNIDPGGYFPLDAMAIPNAAGPITFTITINYNDDFNQLRTITQTLKVMAQDGESGMSGTPMPGGKGAEGLKADGSLPGEEVPVEESLWDKVVRFARGLLGLDSAPPQPEPTPNPEEIQPEEGSPLPAGGGAG